MAVVDARPARARARDARRGAERALVLDPDDDAAVRGDADTEPAVRADVFGVRSGVSRATDAVGGGLAQLRVHAVRDEARRRERDDASAEVVRTDAGKAVGRRARVRDEGDG